MEYKYIAEIISEDEEILAHIEGYSQDSLEEEMGKSKWTKAIESYEGKKETEAEALAKLTAEEEREKDIATQSELDAAEEIQKQF